MILHCAKLPVMLRKACRDAETAFGARVGPNCDSHADYCVFSLLFRCSAAVFSLFFDAINQKKSRTFNGIGVRWGGNLKWIGVSGAAAMWRATAVNLRGAAAGRWYDVQPQ